MVSCDICGKETNLFRTLIEDTELKVCKGCASFGKITGKVRAIVKEKRKKEVKVEVEEPEIIQFIVHDYAEKVKKAREKSGLKQEEVARKISEKASLIHKVETEHYKPSMALAKKLEKFFKIKLIDEETLEKTKEKIKASSSEGLTIGDLLKLRK